MIHTTESGKLAHNDEFIGRKPPQDFKKLRNRIFLIAAVIWFGLCAHGVYCEMSYYGGW